MGQQTRRAFDRFVLQSYQREIVDRVVEYYEEYGSWEEITGSVPPRMNPRFGGMHGGGDRPIDIFTLANVDGQVILAGQQYPLGRQLDRRELERAVPVEVAGRDVGYVIFAQQPRASVPSPDPSKIIF